MPGSLLPMNVSTEVGWSVLDAESAVQLGALGVRGVSLAFEDLGGTANI